MRVPGEREPASAARTPQSASSIFDRLDAWPRSSGAFWQPAGALRRDLRVAGGTLAVRDGRLTAGCETFALRPMAARQLQALVGVRAHSPSAELRRALAARGDRVVLVRLDGCEVRAVLGAAFVPFDDLDVHTRIARAIGAMGWQRDLLVREIATTEATTLVRLTLRRSHRGPPRGRVRARRRDREQRGRPERARNHADHLPARLLQLFAIDPAHASARSCGHGASSRTRLAHGDRLRARRRPHVAGWLALVAGLRRRELHHQFSQVAVARGPHRRGAPRAADDRHHGLVDGGARCGVAATPRIVESCGEPRVGPPSLVGRALERLPRFREPEASAQAVVRDARALRFRPGGGRGVRHLRAGSARDRRRPVERVRPKHARTPSTSSRAHREHGAAHPTAGRQRNDYAVERDPDPPVEGEHLALRVERDGQPAPSQQAPAARSPEHARHVEPRRSRVERHAARCRRGRARQILHGTHARCGRRHAVHRAQPQVPPSAGAPYRLPLRRRGRFSSRPTGRPTARSRFVGGAKRSATRTPSAAANFTSESRVRFAPPASTRCTYRSLTPRRAAKSATVESRLSRSSAMRRPTSR